MTGANMSRFPMLFAAVTVFESARTDGNYVVVNFSEEITVNPQVRKY